MVDKPIPEVIEGLRALVRAVDEGQMSCSVAYAIASGAPSWRLARWDCFLCAPTQGPACLAVGVVCVEPAGTW